MLHAMVFVPFWGSQKENQHFAAFLELVVWDLKPWFL